MLLLVLDLRSAQFEIVWGVVERVVVAMMYALLGCQRTPQNILHDETVLVYQFALVRDELVSGGGSFVAVPRAVLGIRMAVLECFSA
jgi:hypothetical protein